MTAVAELLSETGDDSRWRIIDQGTVFRTELYPSGLPAREVPYAQRYDVAGPGSDEVVAEVEFADRPSTNYAALDREFLVDLSVLGRGNDGTFTTAVEGVTRNRFILMKGLYLRPLVWRSKLQP